MSKAPPNFKQDISLVIVEDDEYMRVDLHKEFSEASGFILLASYADCENAIKQIIKEKPDVVLMDIRLPGMNGVQGVKIIKEKLPATEIIMLTLYEDNEMVFESFRNGASGYLLKNATFDQIKKAVREVMEGGSPMSMRIARKITESFRRRPPSEPLTGRESEILAMICQGKNNQSIANELFISKTTVKFHNRNIYRKLQVTNKSQAVNKAHRNHLLSKNV